jgi:hypothetical protein
MGLFDAAFGGAAGMGGIGKQFGGPPTAPPQADIGSKPPDMMTPQSPFGGAPAQGMTPQPPQQKMAAGGSSVGGGMGQPMMSDLSQSIESKAQKTRLNFMDALAQIESSGGTNTRNLLSPSHVGKYQMSKTAFQRFSNGGDINDPAQQEQAARAYADYNRSSLKQILGRDPTDPEVYLSYNQGLAGAHRLLSNPGVPAGKLVKPQHIAANGGDPAAPASQFINMITQKWNDLSQGAEAGAQ